MNRLSPMIAIIGLSSGLVNPVVCLLLPVSICECFESGLGNPVSLLPPPAPAICAAFVSGLANPCVFELPVPLGAAFVIGGVVFSGVNNLIGAVSSGEAVICADADLGRAII